jgi:hypothetical protein
MGGDTVNKMHLFFKYFVLLLNILNTLVHNIPNTGIEEIIPIFALNLYTKDLSKIVLHSLMKKYFKYIMCKNIICDLSPFYPGTIDNKNAHILNGIRM